AVGSTATRSLLMMSRTVVMPFSKPSRRRLGREALRVWYAPRRRAYPWRGSNDPYAVWVSEGMLQQTQAGRVVPAFRSFLRRFPTVRALAAAPRREVVREWGGLGYYRREVRLSQAPRALVRDQAGRSRQHPERPGHVARAPGHRSVPRGGGRPARVRRAGRGGRHQRAARRRSGAPGGRRARGAGEGRA